jgi:PAS domain S-box-containing protein
MKIRTKLLLVLAGVVLLMAAQEALNLRLASETRADVRRLEQATVAESSAALGMWNALAELEASLTMANNDGSGPANSLPIRNQGGPALQQFRRCLNAAVEAARSGLAITAPRQTTSRNNSGGEPPASLKNLESALGAIERQWPDYTNSLETSPGQARSIRDHLLLPGLKEKLRPALTGYCRDWEDESALQIQKGLARSRHSQQIMLGLMVLMMLAVLAAAGFLAQWVLKPVEQLTRAVKAVAAGNRQSRVQLKSPGEFGGLAGVVNQMLDVLQTTTVSRDELEKTVQERTQKLEREITARQAVEAELRAGEKYLTIILDSIGDGVLVTNARGQVLRLNPVAEQLTGWKTAQAIGQPVNEVFRVSNEQTRQPMPVPVAEVIAAGKTVDQDGHVFLTDRTGTGHPIADSCAPIRDGDGIILGTVLVFRDATRERQAEEQIIQLNQKLEQRVVSRTTELRESERRHQTLLANLQGMAYRCRNNHEWQMEFVSEGCRNLLGVEPEDFTASRIAYRKLIHPEDQERVWDEVQSAIARQGAFTVEYRVKHANGQWRNVLGQGRAVQDSQGQMVALEGYVMDMTQRVEAERERRILEEKLLRAQKIETIGTLAGGIAHDFNNILAAILGSAELMKMDIAPGHPSREFLDQIFQVGHHAREVVQQILAYSQQRGNKRGVIYLQPVVKECMKLLHSTIPPMVDISCHVAPDCSPVLANSTQIYQVIMNLCTNAWQAMPEKKGRIRVNLEMCEIDPTMAASHPGLQTGPAVRLSIRDNGSGIDPATLERIFEPLFTTKPAGKGSGFGLSVVHSIVKAHKGIITVESEPGQGTVFDIYLPPQKGETEKDFTQSSIAFSVKHEHLLFVDDDEFAGSAMEMLLNRLGYQVRRFQKPEEALAHFQAGPADYDLVITDLAMPGMTGDNLAAALLHIRPDIPILITTGVIDSPILKKVEAIGVCNVLLKPVSAETLAGEIARLLVRRSPSEPGGST